jgi:hypothetical protein
VGQAKLPNSATAFFDIEAYLSEPMLGYALARFAYERGEKKPDWASFVKDNIAPYMKRSLGWLSRTQAPRLLS